ERRLYLVRQRAENNIEFNPDMPAAAREDFYVCALSTNRLIYKGMLTATQLRYYFPDLQDPRFTSALAMVHSRFSTNTFPAWRLGPPPVEKHRVGRPTRGAAAGGRAGGGGGPRARGPKSFPHRPASGAAP